MRLAIREEDITLGDIEDFEEITGDDIFQVLEPKIVKCLGEFDCPYDHDHKKGKPVPDPDDEQGRPLKAMPNPKAKQLIALVYIFGRKTDSSLTLESVRDVKAVELEFEQDEESAESEGKPSADEE